MAFNSLIAICAGLGMIIFACFIALGEGKRLKSGWVFPAAVCGLFLVFSVFAVVTEGPLGFWTEHIRNNWGNQIWFDLLLAASIGWYFIVPQAKAVQMNVLFWMVLVVSSGCIGFTAMLARLLYLQEKSAAVTA